MLVYANILTALCQLTWFLAYWSDFEVGLSYLKHNFRVSSQTHI